VTTGPKNALVLAGRRGPSDPLAVSVGASHRALIPIAGVPMLERVLETLAKTGVAHTTISIDEPPVLERVPAIAARLVAGAVTLRRSAESPASSVLDCLRASGNGPVLVTTADHPLLTTEIVGRFWSEAAGSGADIAVGVVTESVFRSRYPSLPRTFIRLGADAFSGANLFAFLTPRGAGVADFWRRAESHRKTPWRLARVFGASALLRFATGRLTVDAALARLEVLTGARAVLVRLPFAEAAIDVDRASDLEVATALLNGKVPSAAGMSIAP